MSNIIDALLPSTQLQAQESKGLTSLLAADGQQSVPHSLSTRGLWFSCFPSSSLASLLKSSYWVCPAARRGGVLYTEWIAKSVYTTAGPHLMTPHLGFWKFGPAWGESLFNSIKDFSFYL